VRIAYRASQFWKALQSRPTSEQLAEARSILTPELMALFLTIQPGEQAHSLKIMEELEQQGQNNPDLQVAALLHDVGKARYPLRVWERIEIVIAKACLPTQVKGWGAAQPKGWKRPFVIAAQHAVWGAEAAAAAGASPLTVELIRRHQTRPQPQADQNPISALAEQYLTHLQRLDDKY